MIRILSFIIEQEDIRLELMQGIDSPDSELRAQSALVFVAAAACAVLLLDVLLVATVVRRKLKFGDTHVTAAAAEVAFQQQQQRIECEKQRAELLAANFRGPLPNLAPVRAEEPAPHLFGPRPGTFHDIIGLVGFAGYTAECLQASRVDVEGRWDWFAGQPLSRLRTGTKLRTQLMFAAHTGNVKRAQYLLNCGADPLAVDAGSNSALHRAAACKQKPDAAVVITRALLERKAAVNALGYDNWTALHVACENGNVGVAEVLLDAGADLALQTRQAAATPLFLARRSIAARTVRMICQRLLASTEELPASLLGDALLSACRIGDLELVRGLLDRQPNAADVNAADAVSKSALAYAGDQGHVHVVRELLQRGADAHLSQADGLSPLFQPCIRGDVATVRALLDGGADVNAVWAYATVTPLMRTCLHGKVEIVRLLLSRGADVSMRDGLSDGTALTAACSARSPHQADIVQCLLQAGSDVNTHTRHNVTPLELAAGSGMLDVVAVLCDAGADIEARSRDSCPLHAAAARGHTDVVRALCARGANVNVRCGQTQCTPLHAAHQNEQLETVEVLLELGAMPEVDAEADAAAAAAQDAAHQPI